MQKVGIIGAGISGLSIAWFLKEKYPELQIDIFEADCRGGKIQHEKFENCILEKGPLHIFSTNPLTQYLSAKLNLSGQLLNSGEGKYYIWKDNFYQKPSSGFLNPENRYMSFSSAGFQTFFGMKKKAKLWDGVSFFDFIKSLFGEVYAETQGSVYSRFLFHMEAEDVEAMMAMPWLAENFKSEADLKTVLKNYASKETEFWNTELGQVKNTPGFYSYTGGMDVLTNALIEDLKNKGVHFENVRISNFLQEKDKFILHARHQKFGPYDTLFNAVSSPDSAPIWKEFDKAISHTMSEVEYLPECIIYTSIDKKQFRESGSGFLAARKEKLSTHSSFFIKNLYPSHCGESDFLIRANFPGDVSLFKDDELISMYLQDLKKVFGQEIHPRWSKVFRMPSAVVKYSKENANRVRQIKKSIAAYKNIYHIGQDMHAPGVSSTLYKNYVLIKSI
jgi:oxygen-dependent protoporphyrinogen oxidase